MTYSIPFIRLQADSSFSAINNLLCDAQQRKSPFQHNSLDFVEAITLDYELMYKLLIYKPHKTHYFISSILACNLLIVRCCIIFYFRWMLKIRFSLLFLTFLYFGSVLVLFMLCSLRLLLKVADWNSQYSIMFSIVWFME